jgi:Tfp pilus assembly protein PilN
MADINLVPQQVKVEQKKQSVIRKTTVLSILMALAVVAVSGYYFVRASTLESEIEEANAEVEGLRSQITDLSQIEVGARNLDLKYKALQEIFDNRVYYSLLLDEFENRVPENVDVDSFSLGQESTINISGKGDNYLAIAEFVNNLSDAEFDGGNDGLEALFTEVTLNSVSLDAQTEVEASFFIVINYNPELLTK